LFLTISSGDRLAALWRTTAMTGLRRSEVCGLQWRDIDLDGGVLSVRRAVVMVRGRPHVKEPKTARSRRSVDLDARTVASLKDWRRRQLEDRLRAGEAWQVGDWVFTNELGELVNPEWVGKRFRRLIAGTDLPTITMRQLRHSHATALLRAGVHPKVVQERLGHASIGVTLDIYSSVLPTMQREAVERLVDLIESR
jgi:integrase